MAKQLSVNPTVATPADQAAMEILAARTGAERAARTKPLEITTPPDALTRTERTSWGRPWGVAQCMLAIAEYDRVPAVHEHIAAADCLQLGGVPFVVLGECIVVAEKLSDATVSQGYAYKPAERYNLDDALNFTRILRAEQVEAEFVANGPGAQVARLMREVAELKGS